MLKFISGKNIRFSEADKENCISAVNKMIELAYIARMKGVLALETEMEQEQSIFLKTAIGLIIDGTNPEVVEHILQNLILSDDYSGAQLLERLIMAEGILAIQSGENPNILALRLTAMLGEKYLPESEAIARQDTMTNCYEFLNTLYDKNAWPESADYENFILSLSNRDLQVIIRDTEHWTLVYALCGFSIHLIRKVLDNVSQNFCVKICADLQQITNPSKESVLEEQKEILRTIKRLEDAGEIITWHGLLAQTEIDRLLS